MQELLRAIKALSDETRIRILNLVLVRECCVCEVMQVLEISQTRASRNLKLLYDAGFLKLRRDGLWAYYSIDKADLKEHLLLLLNAVEQGLTANKTARVDKKRLENLGNSAHGLCNSLKTPIAKMKTVLFICVHNSGRSQMAEAYFNRMAQGKARGISAGSEPADGVNPMVAKAMLEAGIDISRNKPQKLTVQMMEGVYRAITMGCKGACPYTTAPTVDWGLEDPAGQPLEQVRKIRDEIKEKVEKLIEEIVPDKKGTCKKP